MKKLILLLTIMSLLFYSCEKENIAPSPNELIQGKWKIILMGNGDNLKPYESQFIREYYSDTQFREFDTILNQYTYYAEYSMDNNLLIHYYCFPRDSCYIKYKYEFYDNNSKLKLVHQNLISTFNTDVFERIE